LPEVTFAWTSKVIYIKLGWPIVGFNGKEGPQELINPPKGILAYIMLSTAVSS